MTALHYVVSVEDRLNTQLTGRSGGSYVSPPHSLEDAHQLVRMLLDSPSADISGDGPWRRAVAGGERVVTITLADRLFDPAG